MNYHFSIFVFCDHMFFDFIISVQFLPIVPRFQKPCLKPKKINFLLYVSESRKIVLKEI